MEFLTRKIHLPWTLYRSLPILYVATALVLWLFVDHLGATLGGGALVALAAVVALKRINHG